ncbi:formylmethanofuran dehydrogenase subunit B [Nitrosococcus halophilus Nc 4]|uniref:Formylmethanofuran dehydrogenase subunit B n=1 Tax=Nitrosococcus halophilus (strain Nc4) TaxID=472759 RepID=D5C449_NITHN|nr:formylmethanofuran dehydrogenase subunit B [Nitrosococcus halophilus]ADE13237.1 formylmethanofuran dehydrogenase subunit B [Nitrosococcus halophilus Nc 4]
MTRQIQPGVWDEVPSPFCGIAADDLKVKVEGNRLTVLENGCPVTQPAFEQKIGESTPQIQGKATRLETAIARAVEILSQAKLPLISGLATDVEGIRAALALADRYGAVVDHMDSEAALRNILALQDSGWITTTLSEVKNRVDLLLVVGSDIETHFPRFFERYIWNPETLFNQDTAQREIIYLGKSPSGQAAYGPDGRAPLVIHCKQEELPEVVAALRAQVAGHLLQAEAVAGIAMEELAALADRLKQAQYGVVTWAAGQWTFPHAELTIQMLCELIMALNKTTRCSGLPLGGQNGQITANQVCTWQTGYPVRTSFARGYPDYDPYHCSSERLLESGAADALVWISAFDQGRTPPATSIPTVVLGRAGMDFNQAPEVFIPIGTPGIDHPGHTYRSDNVVAVPLRQLRQSGLPSTAEIVNAMLQYNR